MIGRVLIHWQWVALWGLVAACAMATVQEGSQHFGMARMSFPFLIGSFFSGDRREAERTGFTIYLAGGWLFALLYGWVFESLHAASWWVGAGLGFGQALFMLLVLLPLLPSFHPRMASPWDGPEASRRIEPPGFLALHYGARAPLIHIASQMLFGAILGATYPGVLP